MSDSRVFEIFASSQEQILHPMVGPAKNGRGIDLPSGAVAVARQGP